MAETALETQQRLLEITRVKAERKRIVRVEREEHLKHLASGVRLDSAKIVWLRRHMFKTDEELDAVIPRLTAQQRKIIRQFEVPKKSTAFGVEAAAKLVEAEARAMGDTKVKNINVENMTVVLPQKSSANLPAPVVIEVIEDKK